MSELSLVSKLEALLFASEAPLGEEKLLQCVSSEEQAVELQALREALATLQADYAERAIELVKVSSGYRMQVRTPYMPLVHQLWERRVPKYSKAFLETLALIVYRQPVTRAEIEAVRGVTVNPTILKSLLEREWIKVVGHKETPGRPALYATTHALLDHFNLNSLEELPPLPDLADLSTFEARVVEHMETCSEQANSEQANTDDQVNEEIYSDTDVKTTELEQANYA